MARSSRPRANSPAGRLLSRSGSGGGGNGLAAAGGGGRGPSLAQMCVKGFPFFAAALLLVTQRESVGSFVSSALLPQLAVPHATHSQQRRMAPSASLPVEEKQTEDTGLNSMVWTLLAEEADQQNRAAAAKAQRGKRVAAAEEEANTAWPQLDYDLEEESAPIVKPRLLQESIVVPSEVCVLSLSTDNQFKVLDKENYCSLTGYKCRLKHQRPKDWTRSAHWDKIPLIHDALDKDCLYALWVDADTFIATHKPLDDLILKMKGKDLVITASSDTMTREQALAIPDLSKNNPQKLHFNTGVMLWKRSYTSLAFLKAWMAENIYKASQEKNRWQDQEAFIMLMQQSNWTTGPNFPKGIDLRVQLTSPARFNAFPNIYQYGDWLEHFSGTSKRLYNSSFQVEFRSRVEVEAENAYIMT